MEVQNKVSIFIGKFSTEDSFRKFIKENFTDDGDIYSELMGELNVGFIDSQFQEVYFSEKGITNEIIEGFSYSENFANLLNENLSEFNGIILLYDFEFKNIEKLNKLKLAGIFDYR